MGDKAFNILINVKSGTVLNMGVPAIESAIVSSGIEVEELCFSEPENMHAELSRLGGKSAPLLIGGGDGTIRDAAQYMSQHKKAFGILPFGTMNLLATDLNLTSLQGALSAYAGGVETEAMDAAYVNGEIFLCCASIGTMPEASVFREENRQKSTLLLIPRLFLFVVDHLDKNKHQRIRLEIDGWKKVFHAAAVVVSNNRFAETERWSDSNFKRVSLMGGELAVYASKTKSKTAHFRLLLRLMLGHWLKDPDLSEMIGKRITLMTRRRKEQVSVDGEVIEMAMPLQFTLKPKHIKLLVPSKPEGQ